MAVEASADGPWRRGEYVVATDSAWLDLDVVHGYLARSYWSPGIPREIVERAARNSLAFGVYRVGGDERGTAPREQVGYARVVTDHATFAWLCDVYVDPARRGAGIGKELLAAVLAELSPLKLTRVMLATADAHALYAAHGFEPLPDPSMLMVQRRPKG